MKRIALPYVLTALLFLAYIAVGMARQSSFNPKRQFTLRDCYRMNGYVKPLGGATVTVEWNTADIHVYTGTTPEQRYDYYACYDVQRR